MLRYLRSIWIWGINVVLIVVWLPVVAVVRLFDNDPLVRRTSRALRALGRAMLAAQFPDLRISGMDKVDPDAVYMIVSNHQSAIDVSVVSYLKVDAKFIGRDDLFRAPLVGWMLRMSQDIPIDRSDPRHAARALIQCGKVLKSGRSVLSFVEGRRSPDGDLLPFAEAPFRIAVREGASILPVVIEGTGRCLPPRAFLFETSSRMHLRVLDPVGVTDWTADRASELRDAIRAMIAAELDSIRRDAGEAS